MPAHEAWLAFWQPERSGATRVGVLAGACSDCGSALRYSAGPRMARTLAVVALRLDAHCEQRLPATGSRARHSQPAESTAGKEALWRIERHWRRADRQRTGGPGDGASAAHLQNCLC